jgi:hypothetical protein
MVVANGMTRAIFGRFPSVGCLVGNEKVGLSLTDTVGEMDLSSLVLMFRTHQAEIPIHVAFMAASRTNHHTPIHITPNQITSHHITSDQVEPDHVTFGKQPETLRTRQNQANAPRPIHPHRRPPCHPLPGNPAPLATKLVPVLHQRHPHPDPHNPLPTLTHALRPRPLPPSKQQGGGDGGGRPTKPW